MNILYLAHRLPYPPDKGDKIRAHRQLTYLAKRHRVWCACFVDDARDLRHVSALRRVCHELAAIRLHRPLATARGLMGLAGGSTLTESFYASRAMRATIRRWAGSVKFDAVAAFSSSMAPYALMIPGARRLLDLCDLDSQKWLDYAARAKGIRRGLYKIEGDRLRGRERDWITVFDATTLITQAERDLLDSDVPRHKVHVIGNGVELPPYCADSTPSDSPTVGFVGVMDYPPNVDAVMWFTQNCWPKIRRAVPNAQFRIVGQTPSRRVKRLARVPGVTVPGRVEDVLAELNRIDVSVAPLRIARGLQNKVLEAMAAQKPVVLSSHAATGIDADDGRDYVVADRADDIAAHVISLLASAHDRTRLGFAARRFVASKFSWEPILRQYELVVTGMVERKADRESNLRSGEILDEKAQVAAIDG